jgi:hypothetical protein
MESIAMKEILIVHAVCTLILVGIIWYVQIVHYPLFGNITHSSFVPYHAEHVKRTTWLVAPLMLIEACTAFIVVFIPSDLVSPTYAWVGLGLLILIWFSTFFIQVPMHRVLSVGFDVKPYQSLIRTNSIRTLAWTGRGVLAVAML